jgi:hypothetical protein
VLRAVYDTMRAKVTQANGMLQSLLAQVVIEGRDSSSIAFELGLDYGAPKAGEVGGWEHNELADPVVQKFIGTATMEQLHLVAFHALLVDKLSPSKHELLHERADVRKDLWRVAKHLGVDAEAIAKRVEAEFGIATPAAPEKAAAKVKPTPATKKAAKPATKKVAKPAAKKVAKPVAKPVAKKTAKKTLSPASRKRIVDAMANRAAARRLGGKA